jgi:hypothetical protein
MARQASITNIRTAEDDVPTPGLPSLVESLHQLDTVTHQREVTVRAIASQMGYLLPADCTDPDLIQRDISANMRRSVEACLEVGRGLTVLKSACEHGNFIDRLDVLGIDRKVAAKFMASARKFSNVSSNATFQKAIGNQTKLFEMLVLDDEQIEELELTGQTGELKLDDIATMSVKELRAAVRAAKLEDSKVVAELKADAEAKDKVLADKNAKIDQLEMRIHKLENRAGEWHPRVFEICMENTRSLGMAMQHLDQIDTLRDIILTEDFGDEDKETAIEHMAIVYCDSISQLIDRVAELSIACDSVFSGYKDKARPILEVFLNAPVQE